VSKTDELFDLALSLVMYVFIMILIIASIEYYGNWISGQLAMVIIVGGALGFAGATALIELASTRRLRAIDIIIYALLATLYALLAGMTLAYYREAWVIPYSVFGIVGVFAAVFIATELLGRLPNS